MTLQQKMNEFKKDFEAKAPKEAIETMHQATRNLRDSGILEQALKPGSKAPDFSLENTQGEMITLSRLLEKGPVVLGFYRGRW